jgi:hypothetical protein
LRRRVAGRKLDDAIGIGTVDADVLLHLKEKSREARKEHLDEQLIIANASLDERIAVARAEQQLRAEGQLKMLGRDVSRASRLSKAKIDSLTSLEQRIKMMRVQLKDPKNPPIETVISKELSTNDRLQLDRKFGMCQICSRKIILELLPTHITMCTQRKMENSTTKISLDIAPTGNKYGKTSKAGKVGSHENENDEESEADDRIAVYDVQSTVLTAVATFPPQQPRDCKVVGKG